LVVTTRNGEQIEVCRDAQGCVQRQERAQPALAAA
jgi:hypothetical protein